MAGAVFFGGPFDGLLRDVQLEDDGEPRLAIGFMTAGGFEEDSKGVVYLRHKEPREDGKWLYHFVPEEQRL